MDQSRFKRRATQTPSTSRQKAPQPPVKSVIVPEVALPRPKHKPKPEPKMVRLPALDMNLPGQLSPQLESSTTKVRGGRLRTFRRWALRTTAVMLALVIVGGSLVFAQSYNKLHKVFKGGSKPVAAIQANVNPDLLKGEGDGRINVLLLGRGGGDHDGPDLTDTMLLDSIDPVNHTSVLLSIPRDLWVTNPSSPSGGSMKINAAWETGEFKYEGKIAPGSTDPKAIQAGFDQVDQTVESVLGVDINYNAIIDFQAFQQAVDSVGGVTVDVPTDLVDPTMAWQNGGKSLLAAAGVDTFDGAQALNYVRSRETTSDFARAQRQRAVIEAIKTKVDTLGTLSNPAKLSGLLDAFGNNVSTDLSLSDANRLYSIIKNISSSNTSSVGLADAPNNYITTGAADGQSIDLPTAGLNNYGAIQAFVRSQLPDGYILKENAKVLVLNGTATPGLATSTAATLKSYGYNVTGTGLAPTSGYSQTVVVDVTHGRDKYTLNYLQQRFGVSAVSSLPADASGNTINTNGADFVIIVGSDEAKTATQANQTASQAH